MGMADRTPRPERITDWREGRRRRAYELKEQGWSQRAIAAALGVSEGAVSQWLKRARESGGAQALRRRTSPGRPPKLTSEQRAQIPALLAQGAAYYGFIGDVWTTKRVAALLKRHFGVRYHPGHIGRLLHHLNWSVQKPACPASQRDAAAIARWWQERWPALKQRPKRRDARSYG